MKGVIRGDWGAREWGLLEAGRASGRGMELWRWARVHTSDATSVMTVIEVLRR